MPIDIWYTRCPVPIASGIAFQRNMVDDEFDETGFKVRNIQELGPAKADSHFNHSLENSYRERAPFRRCGQKLAAPTR